MSVRQLADRMAGRRTAVLVGAGCSTESGIPDYRGPDTFHVKRSPMQHRAFVGDAQARRRYWARSFVGWPRMAAARPNAAHRALAVLEEAGQLSGVITQNVDGLHHDAGSRHVVELHGALREVVCLGCGHVEARARLQDRLAEANPGLAEAADATTAPDGDVELEPPPDFVVPVCLRCAGVLKPHVVFFGDNVPRERVDRATEMVDGADHLLVVGTSLTVWSGLRFVRRAAAAGKPVAIVNLGPTRGDPFADLRIDGRAGDVLPGLVAELVVGAE
jgi:NAD-dependent SIR2 family protein deacetylase